MDALDGLLGRRSLKERIEKLQEEHSSLEAQLEAEEERRREAVRNRQSAEERINQLEDRVAGLEGELERERDGEIEETWTRVQSVGYDTADRIVSQLQDIGVDREGALSASITEETPEPVRTTLDETTPLIDRIAPCLVYADERRIVQAVFVPPRQPAAFVDWDAKFRIDRDWFVPTGPAAFALVRADLFALGTYREGALTYDTGFESSVMGRHSKGGYSQSRFERRREEQVDEHVERCREELAEVTQDELIVVGDRRIVSRFADKSTATDVVDASGDPADALSDAFTDFWTTRLYIP